MERFAKRAENGDVFYPHCFEHCQGTAETDQCINCNYYDSLLNKFAEYEDLEEQGLLLRLPCKVGDEFWVIAYKSNVITYVKCSGYTIQEDITNRISHKFVWLDSVENPKDYWKLNFEDFKERCFKTREEAEARLKELEGEKSC